jgi:hypothetical protein
MQVPADSEVNQEEADTEELDWLQIIGEEPMSAETAFIRRDRYIRRDRSG